MDCTDTKRFDELREFMNFLEAKGELLKVNQEINSKYELAAVQMKVLDEKDKAVLFTNVDGMNQQIVGNIYSSRRMISYMFGVPQEELLEEIKNLKDARPYQVKYVEDAPCQETVVKDIGDLKEIIPITWNCKYDSGYFITSAIIVCKDPETGKTNSAICRLEYKKEHLTVQLVPNQHTSIIFQKYKKLGLDMPVAIVLGADPIFMFASESGIPYGQDEFEYAGAILGRPFEVVKCTTIEQYVPAKAEIILEGHISISKEEMEGPMGEVTQYYGGQSKKPVVEINCITHKQNPISENIISGTIEEHSLLAVPMEGRLLKKLREISPLVTSVNLLPFFFNCAIQIDCYPEVQEGITKNILLAALAEPWIKTAVIVNKDVNVYCWDDINWAIATRVDFLSDVFTVNDMLGFPLDPMKYDSTSTVSKIGIDATVKIRNLDNFVRRQVVGYESINLKDWLK